MLNIVKYICIFIILNYLIIVYNRYIGVFDNV